MLRCMLSSRRRGTGDAALPAPSADGSPLPDPADDGWCLLRSTAETIGEGYSTQDMMLWDAAGRPLIAARQNVAVFV